MIMGVLFRQPLRHPCGQLSSHYAAGTITILARFLPLRMLFETLLPIFIRTSLYLLSIIRTPELCLSVTIAHLDLDFMFANFLRGSSARAVYHYVAYMCVRRAQYYQQRPQLLLAYFDHSSMLCPLVVLYSILVQVCESI